MNTKKDKKYKNFTEDELYIDEEDRMKILSLPEFEREILIAERVQK
jgi:hypothetical protein